MIGVCQSIAARVRLNKTEHIGGTLLMWLFLLRFVVHRGMMVRVSGSTFESGLSTSGGISLACTYLRTVRPIPRLKSYDKGSIL